MDIDTDNFIRCFGCKKIIDISGGRKRGFCSVCSRRGGTDLMCALATVLVEIFETNNICLLCYSEKGPNRKCIKCSKLPSLQGKKVFNSVHPLTYN